MNLSQLAIKFDTKEKCIAQLEKIKWNGKPVCSHCSSERVTKRNTSIKWHCNSCNKDFSVLHDTVFEGSKMPLPKWFQLIFLMLNAKKGISAKQIHRDIGVTYKSAWYSAMRIRCAMLDWGEMLEGIVEMDETYVGGKPRKRNNPLGKSADNVANLGTLYSRSDNRIKRGKGTKKVAVAGIIERKGRVVAKVLGKENSKTLMALLKKTVKLDKATLMTDDSGLYRKFDEIIERHVINHSSKQYVRGNVHTNTIEGFWSLVKNGIKGQYHVISKKYLPFYLAEFCYRYNRRKLNVSDSFYETLENSVSDEKCFTDYKPKGDVKRIVYPSRKKRKAA
jgi:transposase-like protein/IS1 family transposase